jgi:hypothetical protein
MAEGMKAAVDIRCAARNGRCGALVARLWWTPSPEPLRLEVADITSYTVPRDLAATVQLSCAYHGGNKGQYEVNLRELLSDALDAFRRNGKTATVGFPPTRPTSC